MDRSRMSRPPMTPGEILREESLVPLGMTQRRLAEHMGQDAKVINRIVNGRAAVSAEVALELVATFRTSRSSGSMLRRQWICTLLGGG